MGTRPDRMRSLLSITDSVAAAPSFDLVIDGISGELNASGTSDSIRSPTRRCWTAGAFPGTSEGETWADASIGHDAIGARVEAGERGLVHAGVSGSRPLYVDVDHGAVAWSTSLDVLARSASGAGMPDLTAWADIFVFGAPLLGRTPFEGLRRVPPMVSVAPGQPVAEIPPDDWPWFTADPGRTSIDDVLECLDIAVRRFVEAGPTDTLLSGGWDSRVLTTLAGAVGTRASTAWTTSSDIGTALDELVAGQVASMLGTPHRIVRGDPERVGHDVAAYAAAVDFQTAFHVWLVPLAESLSSGGATWVLDGLGGGIFLDSAFDSGDRDAGSLGWSLTARYADGVESLLVPRVAEAVLERSRDSWGTVVNALDGRIQPGAEAVVAYLTRTQPGIAMGPHGLLAQHTRVGTPFLENDVVRASLDLPDSMRRGGRAYVELMQRLDPRLARLPTATQRTGRRRSHPRRISSLSAATWFRQRLGRGPVAELIAPDLRAADVGRWQQELNTTSGQHVLRSLAVLALWLDAYGEVLQPDADGVVSTFGAGRVG
ncbi:asparagine synthase-related protein [Ilumatobacter nonamiensis]|uniref:asparagine synthase-related protein n=1 Tax=Ilumatobacter nonamiensis TaxID=467093 RepID=UPI00130EFE42|nr:asparagine synthase-related protein [Ilumatobacter nonamiensis]